MAKGRLARGALVSGPIILPDRRPLWSPRTSYLVRENRAQALSTRHSTGLLS